MNKIISFILIIGLMVDPFTLLADNDLAVSFLQNQEQNAWITQSLAVAGIDDLDISYIDADEGSLMQVNKYLLALAAVNSSDADMVNTLITTVNSYFNNGQLGEVNYINDDIWGLLALSSVGSTENIDSIKNFIVNNQNEDGGWSWSIDYDSDTNDTAAAIMALLETDITATNSIIVNAINYLQSQQNEDGGFSYNANSESDGASTAWVISALNKVDIEVVDWVINDNDPFTFLDNLQQDDGSYLWMPSDQESSVLVTSYALLASLGGFYPVNHINISGQTLIGKDIRIEGPDSTICLANNLSGDTVLEVLEEASQLCQFEYTAEETAYGIYISEIAGIQASGLNGWQYWVNWQSGNQSVDVYPVTDGDSILWSFGGFGILATDISFSMQNDNQVLINTRYFDQQWYNLPQVELFVNNDLYISNDNGEVVLTLPDDGIYSIYIKQTEDYIRSPKLYVTIGDGINQSVDLVVNVIGSSGNEEVSFSIGQSNIDFGDLEAGQTAENILQLTNTGNVNIYLEANVLGDDVLTDYLTLELLPWQDFQQDLDIGTSEFINVRLSLPNNFTDSGVKNGQLIFWAVVN